jgi:hypothetical protein
MIPVSSLATLTNPVPYQLTTSVLYHALAKTTDRQEILILPQRVPSFCLQSPLPRTPPRTATATIARTGTRTGARGAGR